MAVLLKMGVMLAAVLLAGAIWLGLVRVLHISGITFLQALAFWISHLSFIGWLFFIVLSTLLYLTFARFLPSN